MIEFSEKLISLQSFIDISSEEVSYENSREFGSLTGDFMKNRYKNFTLDSFISTLADGFYISEKSIYVDKIVSDGDKGYPYILLEIDDMFDDVFTVKVEFEKITLG